MKKNNLFFKSTIYLIIGGFITRSIGFIIKIIYTRIIGETGISLLTIVMPTYSILLTITSLSLPVSLAKLIAEKKTRALKILSNATFIIIVINLLVILIMHFTSDFIATRLLHEPLAKGLLRAMSYTFPFVSISSIIKGYFIGKQRTLPYMISNVLEQIFRLILMIVIIPNLYLKSPYRAVRGIILLSVLSETFSIIVFMFFLPKKAKINTNLLKPDMETEKNILNIAIPTVSGRIIGNIGYFFEPILLTNLLLINGYSNSYILLEYGAYNAYSLSILTMPAFLISAISNAIIPEISKLTKNRKDVLIKRRIKQSIIPTLIMGIIFSVLIIFFRYDLLNILYKTKSGANYILFLAPFFPLFYLESILYSILQARGLAKKSMYISFVGVIVKLLVMSILCYAKIGIYSLLIAEIINILLVISLGFNAIKKEKII